MIDIVRASAGSGKTYTLAKEYISMLLASEDRFAYRHILAVTFTNKATDEMKRRILKELDVLATHPESSPYLSELTGRFIPSRYEDLEAMKSSAARILYNLLHDYGSFSVSTIDGFFQQVLRSFSREIGQFASYQLELDRNVLLQETVDRLLDSLGEAEKSNTLKWLTEKSLETLGEGGRLSLSSTLLSIASRLKTEEYRLASSCLGTDVKEAFSKNRLYLIGDRCRKVEGMFTSSVSHDAAEVLRLLEEAGISPDDMKRKPDIGARIRGYSCLKENDRVTAPSSSLLDTVSVPEKWFPASEARKYVPYITEELACAMERLFSHFGQEYRDYKTAELLRSEVFGLGVSSEILDEYDKLIKEMNVLDLEDSTLILRDLVDGSDTPFIYERTGVWYEHFLLDEFQDTSHVQWANFEPLLRESIANNNDNLIVGDVKQSIYRWRNSDWELLDGTVSSVFSGYVRESGLDTNYRSLGNVVEFNNDLFGAIPYILDRKYGKGNVISNIYRDVVQNVPSGRENSGQVKVSFTDSECEAVCSSVCEAVSNGYSLKDIAVIVRTKALGEKVASALLEKGVSVVTDDSLHLSSSLTVNRLVALMSVIDNPDDRMSSYLVNALGIEVPDSYESLVDLVEDLSRRLKAADREQYVKEIPYVQTFMDVVQDFSSRTGNALHRFLQEWEDRHDYCISCPDDCDSVRIITIHKSKGLDFPYVIVPFIDKISLYESESKWCCPNLDGTALKGMPEAVYDVTLKEDSRETVFADDYDEERLKQYIDNINLLYVAATRAGESLHIISHHPSKAYKDSVRKNEDETSRMTDFSAVMHWYFHRSSQNLNFTSESGDDGTVSFIFGEPVSHSGSESGGVESIPQTFPSWPVNPVPEDNPDDRSAVRKRLCFPADSKDFFSDDGQSGMSASNRVKGIILHDILSRVVVPRDLERSVSIALSKGEMTSDEAGKALALLTERIESGISRGWFPEDGSLVLNETSVFDTDGNVYRPDRVVDYGDSVVIIDYKFGAVEKKYERQICRYADLWRRTGRSNVKPVLWYVIEDKIVCPEDE